MGIVGSGALASVLMSIELLSLFVALQAFMAVVVSSSKTGFIYGNGMPNKQYPRYIVDNTKIADFAMYICVIAWVNFAIAFLVTRGFLASGIFCFMGTVPWTLPLSYYVLMKEKNK